MVLMPHDCYDVIVVGLGAMGSATAAHLSLRGCRVLGLDRWPPGHPFGSSHGDSRIIREIYFEHPMYVPIVRRAYELWRELEARTGSALLVQTGGLMIGPRDGEIVRGTLRAADAWRMAHEVLTADAVARRGRSRRIC
jgi:sarcosine oxidase